MSTRTYTYSASSSNVSAGWPKALIPALAILFFLVVSSLDILYHGHFHCDTLRKMAERKLATRTHLQAYLTDVKDFSGQIESGTVKIECVGDRKLVLTGKVVNEDLRREFSDVVAEAVGTDRVDNQIETLNEGALHELQALLASAPTNMTLNYQVKERGTIYLTGDLPSPELKEKIGALVAKIRGVRSVVNELGRELTPPKMLRLSNIWFDFDQFKIRPQSQPILDEAMNSVEDYLAKSPSGIVRIEGHTDSIASDPYNLLLSQRRANAVLEALVSRGIPRENLRAVGKGKKDLLIRNDDTPEERAENRRIEFHFE